MDPATGASTWALGSQTWTRYIGVLTMKPKVINKPNQKEKVGRKKNRQVDELIKIIKSGNDDRTVYKRRYIDA